MLVHGGASERRTRRVCAALGPRVLQGMPRLQGAGPTSTVSHTAERAGGHSSWATSSRSPLIFRCVHLGAVQLETSAGIVCRHGSVCFGPDIANWGKNGCWGKKVARSRKVGMVPADPRDPCCWSPVAVDRVGVPPRDGQCESFGRQAGASVRDADQTRAEGRLHAAYIRRICRLWLLAAALRDRVISRPQMLTWVRRTFVGTFLSPRRETGAGRSIGTNHARLER